MKRELGIGRCGFACCLCSRNDICSGCDSGKCPGYETCVNRICSESKGLEGCYECTEECRKGHLEQLRPRAFKIFIQKYGIRGLLDCLERNEGRGVVYHREDMIGDYDTFKDQDELIRFIQTGIFDEMIK